MAMKITESELSHNAVRYRKWVQASKQAGFALEINQCVYHSLQLHLVSSSLYGEKAMRNLFSKE